MVQVVEECSNSHVLRERMESSSMSQLSSSDRHIHFHMHMHASPSSAAGPAGSMLQQHHQQSLPQQLQIAASSSAEPYPAFVKPDSGRQQRSATGADVAVVQSLLSLACPASRQQHNCDPSAAGTSSIQQQQQRPQGSSKRQGRRRVRRVLRALLLSGAATAMVLAGAGGALVLLSPRVEQLEARCSQVRVVAIARLLQLGVGRCSR
jgi:hypothetical protein